MDKLLLANIAMPKDQTVEVEPQWQTLQFSPVISQGASLEWMKAFRDEASGVWRFTINKIVADLVIESETETELVLLLEPKNNLPVTPTEPSQI